MSFLTLEEIVAKTTDSTRDEIENDLQTFANAYGFVVYLDSGGNLDPSKGTVKAYFKCIHGGTYQPRHVVNNNSLDENLTDTSIAIHDGDNESVIDTTTENPDTSESNSTMKDNASDNDKEEKTDDKRFYVDKNGVRKRKPTRISKLDILMSPTKSWLPPAGVEKIVGS
ncbi:hypothetical protein O0I10_011949 [Lichtheimia ornata]|uniref:Uncharacterized protein n=1 Tax=Lichtheimia ornata TaxID=688661 RepID=A0AAD7UUB0_9FUNG|nr:uncharacterized protein O0I10_011949 [Lichtheimia ornata]KAJ8652421.1 hypothetical protein O0I10_011949 [Lichtheimia ornata]